VVSEEYMDFRKNPRTDFEDIGKMTRSKARREIDALREGIDYHDHFCPARLTCPSQIAGAIVHYASREALDIEGLGEKTAEDLVKKGLVKKISDLYTLSVSDLLSLDGFAERSAALLHEAIRGAKTPRLDRFLYALGIRHVGERVAGILAGAYRTIGALKNAGAKDLQNIPEIGPGTARSVAEFFSREETGKVLEALFRAGVRVPE